MNTSPPDMPAIRPWIEAQFSRSPGPGGQNVNKVNTRVTILFDFDACPAIPTLEKSRIRSMFRTRLSKDGRLRVVSYRHRTQAKNRRSAEERLIELLAQAMKREKTRKPTRPSVGSKRRRLLGKKQRSELKKQRSRVMDS